MWVQNQALVVVVAEIKMVVDYTAVPVVSPRRSRYVAFTGQYKGNSAAGVQCLGDIVRAQLTELSLKVVKAEAGAGMVSAVKYNALKGQLQQLSAHSIAQQMDR